MFTKTFENRSVLTEIRARFPSSVDVQVIDRGPTKYVVRFIPPEGAVVDPVEIESPTPRCLWRLSDSIYRDFVGSLS